MRLIWHVLVLVLFLSLLQSFVLGSQLSFGFQGEVDMKQTISFHSGDIAKVCVDKYCFMTELAVTLDERQQGLMGRKHLEQNEGMLFVGEREKKHAFWMKDMLIPLDLIWINKNKEIVYISQNKQPCQQAGCKAISPSVKSYYVLEINSGESSRLGLTIGDQVSIEMIGAN